MTNNDGAPVCECGHVVGYHMDLGCIAETAIDVTCECDVFTDARIAKLRAENADLQIQIEIQTTTLRDWAADIERFNVAITRLTPTATRELPTKEGWYWRVNYEIDEWEMIHVRADLDGRLYTESRDDDGTVVIDLVLHGEWWSREPIPEMQIPKEGE